MSLNIFWETGQNKIPRICGLTPKGKYQISLQHFIQYYDLKLGS